jgi:predicted DNA-binding ribbon-helix-helix protein
VLEEQAYAERMPLAGLVARVDASRGERPLASALRVYALMRAVAQSTGPL